MIEIAKNTVLFVKINLDNQIIINQLKMTWEEEIPAVPSREQEKQFLKELEQNFLDQPNYKWYMNEAIRTRKMGDAELYNSFKRQWLFNFSIGILYLIIGLLVSGPAIILLGNHFRTNRTGVPSYLRPKFFYTAERQYG